LIDQKPLISQLNLAVDPSPRRDKRAETLSAGGLKLGIAAAVFWLFSDVFA
jgi:hypothetical protein